MAPKQPQALLHPNAAETLPRLGAESELVDLLSRAQILSLLEPRSTNGRADHPAHQLMRSLEGLRRELPLPENRQGAVQGELANLFRRLDRAGYFVFARIITHRQPAGGDLKGILGVLTVAAAHPKQKVDGDIQW